MTEEEWTACCEPQKLLEFLGTTGNFSKRKVRLFAVGCCRRAWHLFTDEYSQRAVTVAEWDADDVTNKEAVAVAVRGVAGAARAGRLPLWIIAPARATWSALTGGGDTTSVGGQPVPVELAAIATATDLLVRVSAEPDEVRRTQAVLLRDIFGPLPFRSHNIPADVLGWNDRLVVRLAQTIYEEQRWENMPILADALLDAGSDNEEMLTHCRQQGTVHTRGGWVLDLLLGKS